MSAPRQELSTYGASHAYPAFLIDGLGACDRRRLPITVDPDDFTEDGDRPSQRKARERARRVCFGCPFRYPCAQWALDTFQQGVYGATTTKERRVIRARA